MSPAPQVVGMGNGYAPEFWIVAKQAYEDMDVEMRKATGTHYAFWGKSMFPVTSSFSRCSPCPDPFTRSPCLRLILWLDFPVVHDFHAAALAAGGTCNGKGGYRPEYFSLYYASFVIDPLGNNVEVMCIYPGWTQLWWWRSWLPGWKGFENVREVEGKKTL